MSAIFVTIFKIKEIFLTADQIQQKHMSARKGHNMYLFMTRHPKTDLFVHRIRRIFINHFDKHHKQSGDGTKSKHKGNLTKTLSV